MKWLKQLLCKHDWKTYTLENVGPFYDIHGERRILACPKCEKVKKDSLHFVWYEEGGYK